MFRVQGRPKNQLEIVGDTSCRLTGSYAGEPMRVPIGGVAAAARPTGGRVRPFRRRMPRDDADPGRPTASPVPPDKGARSAKRQPSNMIEPVGDQLQKLCERGAKGR